MRWRTWVSPFGLSTRLTKLPDQKNTGYHIEPVIEDLEEQWEQLKGGSFGVNREATAAYAYNKRNTKQI